jgi:flagellar hook-associated protein 1
MSLLGALNIGGSSLAAQQAALQVTGNNLANASNPNYAREVVNYQDNGDVPTTSGLLGTGVSIASVQRQVDQALNEQLRSADSDQSSTSTQQTWSGQVQSVFNALSGNGLSDQLNTFFNDWSTLANNPSDSSQRGVVLQDGQNVAQTLNTQVGDLASLSTNLQTAVGQSVQQVNQLTGQIASLNQQIVTIQAGAQQANALQDQRDGDLEQLSQLTNIQTVNESNGSVDVYIGSDALVQGATSQNLSATTVENNGHTDSAITFQDGSTANITSGQIGGLFQSQSLIDTTTDSVNSIAAGLISAVNSVYSSGQGLEGYTSVTGTNAVTDPTQSLIGSAGLEFPPKAGSFVVTPSGGGGTQINITSSTTLNSLAASLNSISGVQATVSNGQLTIQSTTPGTTITFSQDTSGVLSALGINTYFSGTDASSIAVNSQVASNPSLLAASADGSPDDNTTALAIYNLGTAPVASLNGASIGDTYDSLVQNVGSAASNATSNYNAASAVQQTLSGQQQALGGVSTDEEALNMIIEQRTYQGAAQMISTIDTMLQSLLSIT